MATRVSKWVAMLKSTTGILLFALLTAIAITGYVAADPKFSLDSTIRPIDVTKNAILEAEVRIDIFFAAHQRLPAKLSDMPSRGPDYWPPDNRFTDGWGRELNYLVKADGTIVISSYGPTGIPASDGAITLEFKATDPYSDNFELANPSSKPSSMPSTNP
jgi:hypothetical protein